MKKIEMDLTGFSAGFSTFLFSFKGKENVYKLFIFRCIVDFSNAAS